MSLLQVVINRKHWKQV